MLGDGHEERWGGTTITWDTKTGVRSGQLLASIVLVDIHPKMFCGTVHYITSNAKFH